MHQPSINALTAIAAIFGFHLWSTNVSQTYMQSGMELLREVYIRPMSELDLPPGTVLLLLRPLYGLPDAGDYCHATFERHMQRYLSMKQKFGDLALLFKHVNGQLMGLTSKYVDDSLLAGTSELKPLNEHTGANFPSSSASSSHFAFSGIELTKKLNTVLLQKQKQAERRRFVQPKPTTGNSGQPWKSCPGCVTIGPMYVPQWRNFRSVPRRSSTAIFPPLNAKIRGVQ